MPGFIISQGGGDAQRPSGKIEPLRSYRWHLDEIIAPSQGGEDSLPGRVAAEIEVPQVQFDEQIVLGMSIEYKFIKRPRFPDMAITFYDIVGLQQIFEDWVTKHMWNPEKGIGADQSSSPMYKGSLKFSELDAAGSPVAQFEIKEAWPKSIEHSRLSYSDNSLKMLTVRFAYEYYLYRQMGGNAQPAPPPPPANAIADRRVSGEYGRASTAGESYTGEYYT